MWLLILLSVILSIVLAYNLRIQSVTWPATDQKEPFLMKDLHDVYHVAFLLRQKLPAELATEILDYAECWVKSSASCSYHMTVTERDVLVGGDGQEMRGVLYHTSALISGTYEQLSALHPVRRVVFTISSRDQGWSDYRASHGTYNDSWSWFEAEVLNWGPDSEADAVPPRRITCNIHAHGDYHTHVVEWNYDSDDADERAWVRRLRRGSKIGIDVWARYPGWTNSVRSANIDVYTRGVR